jgi:hypothetical protein
MAGRLQNPARKNAVRTEKAACAVIAGIEAVQMIRKGQAIGITKKNLHGQGLDMAWAPYSRSQPPGCMSIGLASAGVEQSYKGRMP